MRCMPSFAPSSNCGPCLAAAAGASAGLKHEAGPGAHAETDRMACREPPPRDEGSGEELEDGLQATTELSRWARCCRRLQFWNSSWIRWPGYELPCPICSNCQLYNFYIQKTPRQHLLVSSNSPRYPRRVPRLTKRRRKDVFLMLSLYLKRVSPGESVGCQYPSQSDTNSLQRLAKSSQQRQHVNKKIDSANKTWS